MDPLRKEALEHVAPVTPLRWRAEQAWRLYLARPELAIVLAGEVIAASAATNTRECGWAFLARALARCRSMESVPNADKIHQDFARAAQIFADTGDERGLRLAGLSAAAIAMREGRWPQALREFEALIGRFDLNTLDADNFYLCFGLSTCYVYQGRLEEGMRFGYAALHLAQQLELIPEIAAASLPLGVALMAAKDNDEADSLLETAIAGAEQAGSTVLTKTLRNNRAVALRRLGRLDEARALVNAVLEEPAAMIGGQQFAHFNAAELFLKRAELGKAEFHLNVARKLLAEQGALGLDLVKIHFIEGVIAGRRGHLGSACKEFSIVDRMLPEVSALRFNDRAEFYDEYADALSRAGRLAEAFAAQRKSSGQYRHSLMVVNRVRRFAMRVRQEISRVNADLVRETIERRELQAVNLKLREQIDLSMAEAEKLRDQASHDALTGIFNRRYLDDALPSLLLLSQQSATPFAVVMVDLDHFKRVNDRGGHAMGDKVLASFAQLAREGLRGSDIVGRYGGEEFCLALIGCGPDAARQRISLLLDLFRALEFAQDGQQLAKLTFSAGIAVYPDDGIQVRELILNADKRLLRAKQAGRAQIHSTDEPAVI
ncbi:MAG: diguanylate cyclase [Betaproteobacteria bacterium]